MIRFLAMKSHLPWVFSVLLLMGHGAWAQKEVSGQVTDENGDGIPGATVLIKGTTSGTVTDVNGNFKLSVSEGATLVITTIGYQPVEVLVSNQTSFNISMSEQIEELNEVVVIGYGSVQKKDLTGVVNKVTSKDFNKGMLASPDQLIAGKVAGVQISQTGEPGGNNSIRIRGGSTFGGNAEPLYVVDGVPISKSSGHRPGGQGRNPLNFINPSDIEDITVLKDASAAAIYGVQGASGVIIITTKSGKSGKLQISYDGSASASILGEQRDMLSTEEFRFAVDRNAPANALKLGTADTDWVDEVTRTPVSTNHAVSASFGGKTNGFRISANYQNLNGVLQTSQAEKYTGSIKYDQRMFKDQLKITLSNSTTFADDRLAPNVMNTALLFDPTQPVRVEGDTINGGFFEWPSQLAPVNPVSSIDQTFTINKSLRHYTTLTLDYKLPFLDGLSLKGNLGYDKQVSRRQSITLETLRPLNIENPGGLFFERGNIFTRTYEFFLSYEKAVGDHNISANAGHSFQEFRGVYPNFSKLDSINLSRYNTSNPLDLRDDDYFFDNSDLFLRNTSDLNSVRKYALGSLWGRVNYNFKNKYYLTATVRYDGSSRFGLDNNFAAFPSLAVAWRVIDEPFAQPLQNTFSELKLRVGVGTLGNQSIDRDFGYVNLYELGNETAQYILGNDTVRTLRPSGANPDIQWETTTSYNVGIDFGLFEGRVNGSLDAYIKETSDLLFEVTYPIGVLTTDREFANVAGFETRGIELVLNSYVVTGGDFTWDLGFNFAHYTDEVTALDFSNDPDFPGYRVNGISGDVGQTIQLLRLSERVNAFYVFEHIFEGDQPRSDGTDFNGDGLADDLDLYVDQNGDNLINENDLIPFESPTPDFILGLTSNFRYKNWDVAFTLRSQLGNYVYNNFQSQFGAFEETIQNTFAPQNAHRSAFENDFTERQLLSSVYIENASFLKVDNITVGYTFNEWNNVKPRVYFTGTNLLTITGYDGPDPEAGGILGIDNNPYPFSSMFIFGVSATFN